VRDGGGQDDAPVVVTLTRRARCRHPDITLLCVGFSTEICDAMRCPEHTCQTSIFKYISRAVSSRKRHVKTRSVAHSTSRARLGSNDLLCNGYSTERWDAMRCPEHTCQTSILQYISSSRSSRKRHVKTRSVAHSTSRARLGSNDLLCDGFSTELCDAMRCPERACQTSILFYISRAVSSRKRHVKTRSVAHSTSRARLGGRQSCVCSARWRSVRARDSTIVRRILTAQQGSDLARQVSVVQPASDVCVACSGLPTLARCPPSSCSPQARYVIEDGKRLDTLLKTP